MGLMEPLGHIFAYHYHLRFSGVETEPWEAERHAEGTTKGPKGAFVPR